jgi:hypothetical protein
VSVQHCGRTYVAPKVKMPAMASRFFAFRLGRPNKTRGVRKMAMSKAMFDAEWAL